MKNRIFFKLVLVFTCVIAAATLTLNVAITHAWQNSLRQQIESNLRQKTAMFALRMSGAPLSPTDLNKTVQRIAEASGTRATVIDSQGRCWLTAMRRRIRWKTMRGVRKSRQPWPDKAEWTPGAAHTIGSGISIYCTASAGRRGAAGSSSERDCRG